MEQRITIKSKAGSQVIWFILVYDWTHSFHKFSGTEIPSQNPAYVPPSCQSYPSELNLKKECLSGKKELEALADNLNQVYYQNYKSAYKDEGVDESKYDYTI